MFYLPVKLILILNSYFSSIYFKITSLEKYVYINFLHEYLYCKGIQVLLKDYGFLHYGRARTIMKQFVGTAYKLKSLGINISR